MTLAAVAVAVWVAAAPYVWGDLDSLERAVLGPVPGGVAAAFACWDYALWRRRGRPWHDWQVIVLLLPAIAAGVWVAVGAVGPGVALVGLLTTTISYHGRHHPDEYRQVP